MDLNVFTLEEFNPNEFKKKLRELGLIVDFSDNWILNDYRTTNYYSPPTQPSSSSYGTISCITTNPATVSYPDYYRAPNNHEHHFNWSLSHNINMRLTITKNHINMPDGQLNKYTLENFIKTTDPNYDIDVLATKSVDRHIDSVYHKSFMFNFFNGLHYEFNIFISGQHEKIKAEDMPKIIAVANFTPPDTL